MIMIFWQRNFVVFLLWGVKIETWYHSSSFIMMICMSHLRILEITLLILKYHLGNSRIRLCQNKWLRFLLMSFVKFSWLEQIILVGLEVSLCFIWKTIGKWAFWFLITFKKTWSLIWFCCLQCCWFTNYTYILKQAILLIILWWIITFHSW